MKTSTRRLDELVNVFQHCHGLQLDDNASPYNEIESMYCDRSITIMDSNSLLALEWNLLLRELSLSLIIQR